MIPFIKRYALLSCLLSSSLLAVNLPAHNGAGQVDTSVHTEEQLAEESEEADEEPFYLFSPIGSTTTYLMDAQGYERYRWESAYRPGLAVDLLDDGSLLRTGAVQNGAFDAGGAGGVVEVIAPDSSVSWSFSYADADVQAHHDIALMPNGHVLMVAWELVSRQDAIAAGRDPDLLSEEELWADHIIEVDPETDTIVWEWHVMDHLVQDIDSTKLNYGDPAAQPDRIDINYVSGRAGADWTHVNAIDYDAELDQILFSVHGFSEIWIIDHDISRAEAAGEAGDLLYRWGNPQAYGSGDAQDQQLFSQHDAHWIAEGNPGAGSILVFNNGDPRLRPYSSVDEITPPVTKEGTYVLEAAQQTVWSYQSAIPTDFFADHISSAQRLENGNTVICDGVAGRFFMVTPAGETVWEYDYGGEVFRLTAVPADSPALENLSLYQGAQVQAAGGSTQGGGKKRPTLR